MSKKIIVLGAGVSGLTVAISLLRHGYKDVLVVAKHVPGDLTTEYTSPWAGASILTVADYNDYRLQDIDAFSMKEFKRLAEEEPEANIMFCPGVQFCENPPAPEEDIYWVKKLYANVKEIPKNELIPGVSHGYTFDSYTANVPKYLKWLVKSLTSLGGRIERKSFDSIQQVYEEFNDADIIVNCTGLGSYHLKDVQDHTMYPIRGQTVLVHAPHVKTQYYIDGLNCWTYIIPRNDGTVICGGTVDRVKKETEPNEAITKDILQRCYNLYPEITHGKGPEHFDIISINVGFRPGRENGIRIEKEIKYRANGKKVIVCHNYGHGSHGYQSSWGASAKVIELISNDRISKL
ncbi:MAG: FAD dependent oxidoreductase [Benjaminiella poitrasii]|nr:MAG: FAD dependent oxidoreductase [Benjaminiella poitrasii]